MTSQPTEGPCRTDPPLDDPRQVDDALEIRLRPFLAQYWEYFLTVPAPILCQIGEKARKRQSLQFSGRDYQPCLDGALHASVLAVGIRLTDGGIIGLGDGAA